MELPSFFGHFELISTLSNGVYTSVCVARDTKTSKEVCCKIFSRQHPTFALVEQEIRIQKQVEHQFIVPIYEVVYTSSEIIMVMEYFDNGDLFSALQTNMLASTRLHRIFRQIVEAIVYLHKLSIAHLDIKPDNIFIDDEFNAKLGDFGCCETPVTRNYPFFGRGTIGYAAPEIFVPDDNEKDHRSADIWSLGVLLYAMITKHLPWKSGDDEFIKSQILVGEILEAPNIPKPLMEIISKCCVVNPKERLTANQLLDLLNQYSCFFGSSKCLKKGMKNVNRHSQAYSSGINIALSKSKRRGVKLAANRSYSIFDSKIVPID